jgi:3-oxoacyl-(acyl-carrier-protein) synthase III
MASLTVGAGRPSRILGAGAYRPRRAISTEQVAQELGVSPEWVTSRTGVLQRHRATDDETVVAMADRAARQALSASGRQGHEADCVVVATITNPRPSPAVAPQVADRLGVSAAAFDVNAACAGFCYALELARALVAAGSAECVVVVGADRLLDIVDPDDRDTAVVFGDGAGAVVVGPADEPGIGPAVWGSAGERGDALEVTPSHFAALADPSTARPWLRMDGTAVARWVAATVPGAVVSALKQAGVDWPDIAAFVPHQAGWRLITRVAGLLDLPEHVVVADDVHQTGNTSAAAVPLALASLIDAGRVHPGDLAALMGFGAGLAFAGQVVRVP